jgi:hypothetical protein
MDKRLLPFFSDFCALVCDAVLSGCCGAGSIVAAAQECVRAIKQTRKTRKREREKKKEKRRSKKRSEK